MNKKSLSVIFLLICLSSLAALGSSSALVANLLESVQSNPITKIFSAEKTQKPKVITNENLRVKQPSKSNEITQNVPDKIVYFILFNHLVGLKNQAEQDQNGGEPAFDYYDLYEQQADLNESQSQFLFQTAQDCLNAIKPIDDEAKLIIAQARANFPNGEVPSPESLPPPPAGLGILQQQRDAVVLQYRDVLENVWGADKFAEFDQFARQKIAPQITALTKINLEEKGGAK